MVGEGKSGKKSEEVKSEASKKESGTPWMNRVVKVRNRTLKELLGI